MAAFTGQLDAINALADNSPGFVWRLQSESGNAADIQVGDNDKLIVNMSVWESLASLNAYVYKTGHRDVMVNRRQWFERPEKPFQTLWWVNPKHTPTLEEGMARLALIRAKGPTPEAFTFKANFPPPNR